MSNRAADLGPREDVDLVDLVRGGDAAALEELWRRHYGLVVALLRPAMRGDAEDIASEAFTTVWMQIRDGGGPERHFTAYLMCVAKRLAWRRYRERLRFVDGIVAEDLPASEADDPSIAVEARDRIASALDAIPARWSEVLWLRAVEQRTRAELGEQFGLSPNAASALTRRARSGFRRAFELTAA